MKRVFPVLFFLSLIVWAFVAAYNGGDFDVFLDAGQKISLHQNIYQPPFIKGLQYFYSPLFALLLIPFSKLPFFITEFSWLLFSFWCLYRFIILSEKYFANLLSNKERLLWILIAFLALFRFLRPNITMIQVTIFLMWATMESLYLFENKKTVRGSLLLAIAINVKLLPLLFLPYLIYRNYLKEFLLTVSFILLFLFLPVIFLGINYSNFLLTEWWKIINPGNQEHILETGLGGHSLSALIPVYITDTSGEMDLKRNFINLDAHAVNLILNGVRVLFILTTLFFLKTWPLKRLADRTRIYWEISYLFLITPLLFPHQQKYAFICLLPQVLYLNYFFMMMWKSKSVHNHLPLVISYSLLLLFFSPIIGSDIIGRYLFDYLQHFRVLTIAVILLIPISLICNPGKLSEMQKQMNEI